MIKIFETSHWEELICPQHHIRLTYKKENNDLASILDGYVLWGIINWKICR